MYASVHTLAYYQAGLATLAACAAVVTDVYENMLQDLQHAIDLTSDKDAKAESHTERGVTLQKTHDFRRAVKDLKQVCPDMQTQELLLIVLHSLR